MDYVLTMLAHGKQSLMVSVAYIQQGWTRLQEDANLDSLIDALWRLRYS